MAVAIGGMIAIIVSIPFGKSSWLVVPLAFVAMCVCIIVDFGSIQETTTTVDPRSSVASFYSSRFNGLLVLGLSGFFIFTAIHDGSYEKSAMHAGGIFIATAFAVLGFYSAVNKRLVFQITRHGIISRDLAPNGRLVPWASIKKARHASYAMRGGPRHHLHLELDRKFVDAILTPTATDKWFEKNLGWLFSSTSRTIDLSDLSANHTEVMQWIKRFAPATTEIEWSDERDEG